MHILYDETAKGGFSGKVKYDQLNATKHWLKHFDNYKFLQFIFDRTNNPTERRQASKEMVIANRKMAYWVRHPNYDHKLAEEGKQQISGKWNSQVKPLKG